MRFLQLLCLAGALASALNADLIAYDNTSESSAGADVVDFFGPLYNSFTSIAAAPIANLQLILSDDGDDTSLGAVDVGLYADDATTPGDLIAILGSVSDSELSGSPAVYDVTLTASPTLAANTLYWVGLSGTTAAEWYYDYDTSGIGVSGEFFSNQFGTFSDSDDPYQMSITQGMSAAPEPSGGFLIFLGAVVLALGRFLVRPATG